MAISFVVCCQVGDTECSSTLGPLQAVEMFYKRKPDAFIGPVCPYVLAPVVRLGGLSSFLFYFYCFIKILKVSNFLLKYLCKAEGWATFEFKVRQRLERPSLQHWGDGGHLQTERQGIQIPHVFRKALSNFIMIKDEIIKLWKLTREDQDKRQKAGLSVR